MINKRIFSLITFSLLLIIFSNVVFAITTKFNGIGDVFNGIKDVLANIFGDNDLLLAVARIMVFLLVFIIVYMAGTGARTAGAAMFTQNITIALASIFGLMTIIFTPEKVIVGLIQEYQWLFILLLSFVPLIGALLFQVMLPTAAPATRGAEIMWIIIKALVWLFALGVLLIFVSNGW